MDEKRCLEIVKKEYPKSEPHILADHDGYYYVQLDGEINPDGFLDVHYVDKDSGEVSGSIPFGILISNSELWNKIIRTNNKKNDTLAHHGIKGQQWGVRNGPPYPLSSEEHNKVVKQKNGKQTGKAQKLNLEGLSPEAVSLISTLLPVALYTIASHIISKITVKRIDDYTRKRVSNFDEELSEHADVREFSNDNPPKKIKGDHTQEQDAELVNPKYDTNVPQTAANCGLCSITYDLRRKGYDVTAKLTDSGIHTENVIRDLYDCKGPDKDVFVKPTAGKLTANWVTVYDWAEKKYPEGSRGVLCARIPFMGIGHAMAWEIRGGKFTIIDTQSNKVYDFKKESMHFDPFSAQITRLDNMQIKDWSKANIVCAELKDGWKKKPQEVKDDHIAHYGIPGQKWGVRNWQNEDGSYTEAGRQRYWGGSGRRIGMGQNQSQMRMPRVRYPIANSRIQARNPAISRRYTDPQQVKEAREKKIRRLLTIGGGITLAAIAGYAAYKGSTNFRNKQRDAIWELGRTSILPKSARNWSSQDFTNYAKQRASMTSQQVDAMTRRKAVMSWLRGTAPTQLLRKRGAWIR